MKRELLLGLILLTEMVSGMALGGLYDHFRKWYYLVAFIVVMLGLIATTIWLSIKLTEDDEKEKE